VAIDSGPDGSPPGFVSVKPRVTATSTAVSPKSEEPPASAARTRLPGSIASASNSTLAEPPSVLVNAKVAEYGPTAVASSVNTISHSAPGGSASRQLLAQVKSAGTPLTAAATSSVGGES